ncbi:hypothetical protein BD410DRAFT_845048 [Rickenella mellea]|uniref:DUF6534 domain-containing protein n=1 Tax=Rickenella mellea TaxID=50990 RepID=A0A4Y7PK73_9AGAM|nr:hypothetical protein BD410DRAFT_845048 [Rickenella mellea]
MALLNSTDQPLGLNIEVFMGPALIGVFSSATFYLLTCYMTYQYFNRFQDDVWYYKFSVAIVWYLSFINLTDSPRPMTEIRTTDTAHLICGITMIYQFLILHYGQPETMLTIPRTLLVMLMLNTVSEIVCHTNVILKVWKLSAHKKETAVTLFALILIRTAFSIGMAVEAFKIPSFLRWTFIGTLVLDIILDMTLCAVLSYFLLANRTRNPNSRTDPIVFRIIQYLVGTGVLSCACGILTLISVLAFPKTLIYLTPLILLEKLSVLSFLVMSDSEFFSSFGVAKYQVLCRINSRHMLRRMHGRFVVVCRACVALNTPVPKRNSDFSDVELVKKVPPFLRISDSETTGSHNGRSSVLSDHPDYGKCDA